ncbi:hypothetical protein OCU04_011911 [Sclerotinia nivalis]|uniref:Uncharacterized protein n=1 Tax=Sclerotinia nivalis TaxID=352851 RepID=A0A9X0A9Y8_9HELO|nr:hypothetical protein OCU04_011911 [Sclerotinia nivalis]
MEAPEESRSFTVVKLSRASQYHVDHLVGGSKYNQPAAKRPVRYNLRITQSRKKANLSYNIHMLWTPTPRNPSPHLEILRSRPSAHD